MKKDVCLLGVKFKCAKGHEWQSAVGGVWLQMPTCPECNNKMNVPAVSWIGIWSHLSKQVESNKLTCCAIIDGKSYFGYKNEKTINKN